MIIAVVGPTGVGKTALSLHLAKKYNGEVINADSTQVYKEMNIGTAKINDFEGIAHHLINKKSLNKKYSIYDFQHDARAAIDDILKRGKNPILVGGSGLYISAVLYDYKFREEKSHENHLLPSVTAMNNELKKIGINIHENNNQRISRSYVKYIINKELPNNNAPKIYDSLIIGLTTSKEILYERINDRVYQMIKQGLEKEAYSLYIKYPDSAQLKSTIGYKEFIPYFKKEAEIKEVIDKIQQNTRRYAKRQYTWFNNKIKVEWFQTNYDDFNKTFKEVENYIKINEAVKKNK